MKCHDQALCLIKLTQSPCQWSLRMNAHKCPEMDDVAQQGPGAGIEVYEITESEHTWCLSDGFHRATQYCPWCDHVC